MNPSIGSVGHSREGRARRALNVASPATNTCMHRQGSTTSLASSRSLGSIVSSPERRMDVGGWGAWAGDGKAAETIPHGPEFVKNHPSPKYSRSMGVTSPASVFDGLGADDTSDIPLTEAGKPWDKRSLTALADRCGWRDGDSECVIGG